jgi:hypothetical protein
VNEGFLPYERICCVHIKKPKASKNVHWLYFKPYPELSYILVSQVVLLNVNPGSSCTLKTKVFLLSSFAINSDTFLLAKSIYSSINLLASLLIFDTSLDGKKFSVLISGNMYLCTSSSVEATLTVLAVPTGMIFSRKTDPGIFIFLYYKNELILLSFLRLRKQDFEGTQRCVRRSCTCGRLAK